MSAVAWVITKPLIPVVAREESGWLASALVLSETWLFCHSRKMFFWVK